MKKWQTDRF